MAGDTTEGPEGRIPESEANKVFATRDRMVLSAGAFLIVVGIVILLSGVFMFLNAQAASRDAQRAAEREGLGSIPGVGQPDIILLIIPAVFASLLIAVGLALVLMSRQGRSRVAADRR